MKRIPETNVSLALFGGFIVAFSLGSIFAIQLVIYGYYLLIASALISASYVRTCFMGWYRDIKIDYSTHIYGLAGGTLLVLFLGMQSSFFPFKIYLLAIGFILFIPAIINVIGGKRT